MKKKSNFVIICFKNPYIYHKNYRKIVFFLKSNIPLKNRFYKNPDETNLITKSYKLS